MEQRAKTGIRVVLGILAVYGGGVAIKSIAFPVATYRFRMTVEVDTPEGVRSGSSVYKVTAYEQRQWTAQEHRGGGGLRGEAVVVNLRNGPVFAIFDENASVGSAATLAFNPINQPIHDIKSYVHAVDLLGTFSALGTTAVLPRKDWPSFVRFRDINDPSSVEPVQPESIGVKRISLKVTFAHVGSKIDNILPWLSDQKGGLVHSPRRSEASQKRFGEFITKGSFIRR